MHDQIEERNLQAADGIDREGGRVEPAGDDVLVVVDEDDLDADRQREGQRIAELLAPERRSRCRKSRPNSRARVTTVATSRRPAKTVAPMKTARSVANVSAGMTNSSVRTMSESA